jgi:hypothetical protein
MPSSAEMDLFSVILILTSIIVVLQASRRDFLIRTKVDQTLKFQT